MSKTIKAKAWVRGDNGLNWMLEMGDWWISYNPNTSKLGNAWSGESEEETAICVNGNYYILNGDFRKEYEALVDKGLDACIAFFKEQAPEHISSWSNTPPANKEISKAVEG